MEHLPEIDDHARLVAAPADRTWRALLGVVAGLRALPQPLTRAWGLDPDARTGDWDHPAVGDTIPGFAVTEADVPWRLTLRGRHRFSRYEIRFTVEPAQPGEVTLHVRTAAAFPGLPGRTYRALVIGSGGHVLVVRRLLARVADRAGRSR